VEEVEGITLFFTLIPVLALLSNYDRENCLINVGTEGIVPVDAYCRPEGQGQWDRSNSG